jgi:methylated-DNA-protein-cysteine methyltransferase related protein
VQVPVGFRIIAAGSDFEARVEEVVRAIPAGSVSAYSAVAEQAGRPGAARAVGSVMARSDGLPWHRVVTMAGRLVPGHEREHAERLRAEGVRVRNGHVAAPIPWWPEKTGSDPNFSALNPRRGGTARSSRGSPR